MRCTSLYLYGAKTPGILMLARIASIILPSRNIAGSPVSRLVEMIVSGISVSSNVFDPRYFSRKF